MSVEKKSIFEKIKDYPIELKKPFLAVTAALMLYVGVKVNNSINNVEDNNLPQTEQTDIDILTGAKTAGEEDIKKIDTDFVMPPSGIIWEDEWYDSIPKDEIIKLLEQNNGAFMTETNDGNLKITFLEGKEAKSIWLTGKSHNNLEKDNTLQETEQIDENIKTVGRDLDSINNVEFDKLVEFRKNQRKNKKIEFIK